MMDTSNISLKDNILIPNFSGMKSRNYAISVKYFDKNLPSPTKRIDYHSEISIIPKEKGWLVSISKENIRFNNHEPDLISEMITDELSKTIYPIQVEINQFAEFVEISNFKYLVNSRWHRQKFRATQKYTTPLAQSFYNAFEKNLESRNHFEDSMKCDWFWNLFFHQKYIDYGNEHSVKTTLYLAVVPYEYPIEFTGIQKIFTEITNYNSVEIHFISDEMKAHEYFASNSKDTAFMRLKVYFDLDMYYFFPIHTRAYFEVYSKDSGGNETLIKRIEFTQYQKDTKHNKTTLRERKSMFLVYDEEEEDETDVYKIIDGKSYTYQQWKKFEEEQYKIYLEKKSKKGFWDFFK